MGISFPSLPSGGNSRQLFALENIPGLAKGLSLDILLNRAKFAEAKDAFVKNNKPSEDKLHADVQKTLSPQRFSFLKMRKRHLIKAF